MRKILLVIFILVFPMTLYGGENSVEITYFGHSMFLIKGSFLSIITDPFDPAVGFPMPDIKADIVTVSHNHFDHNNVSAIKGNPTVVREATDVKGIKFLAIPSYHDNKKGTLRGNNTIIKWTLEGITFAHLGDFGEDELSKDQYEKLKGIDILFIPAGGIYTIDANKAYSIIQRLNPKIAIVMHYRTGSYGLKELASIDEIKKAIPGLGKKSSTLKISKSSLPKKTRIVYMEI